MDTRPHLFAEPFAGGAIVGLSVAFEMRADTVILVELDDDVAAVWKTILGDHGERLASKIACFALSAESVRSLLSTPPKGLFEAAFTTIVRNRVQRGGILAPGAGLMKRGENGRGLASRWYPDTLKERILNIVRIKDRIGFVHGDGIRFIQENAAREDAVFFIDPPYTVSGRRLYSHSDLDHEQLFEVVSKVRGDFIMTYDNAQPIRDLACRFGLQTREVPMKSTHHALMTELLIGRDLRWYDPSPTARSSPGYATRTPPS